MQSTMAPGVINCENPKSYQFSCSVDHVTYSRVTSVSNYIADTDRASLITIFVFPTEILKLFDYSNFFDSFFSVIK